MRRARGERRRIAALAELLRDDRELVAVEAALAALPLRQRAVVVLRYYFDLAVPEIAATLQIPVGTAKSRLHRSLAVMRTALADIDPDGVALARGQLA